MLLFFLYSAVALLVLHLLRNAFRPGFVDIPGPLVARFSDLWRVYKVWQWSFKEELPALHKAHGTSLLRIGPNLLSCSDPAAVNLIYGFQSRFQRVGCG